VGRAVSGQEAVQRQARRDCAPVRRDMICG
jgi:hypothetical protein